jgi:hypothetical protein
VREASRDYRRRRRRGERGEGEGSDMEEEDFTQPEGEGGYHRRCWWEGGGGVL